MLSVINTSGQIISAGATGPTGSTGPTGPTGPTGAAVLNSVLSGKVNATGWPDIITDAGSLDITIDATTPNLYIAFCAGYNSSGPIQYIAELTADSAALTLTDDARNYIYAERNSGTGAVTFGKTSVIPEYRYYKNASPSEGMHNFVIPENVMYLYSSSSWTAKQRVFVGEVVTAGGDITQVINYAFRNDYAHPTISTMPKTWVDSADIQLNMWQSCVHGGTISSTVGVITARNLQEGGIYSLRATASTVGILSSVVAYGALGATVSVGWAGGSTPVITSGKPSILVLAYQDGQVDGQAVEIG